MKIRDFVILQLSVLIYSLSSILSKFASKESFLSWKYILFMGLMVMCLGIYAIIWQQILKKINLSVAFASKGTTVLWSIILGFLIFHEKISYMQIFGAFIVMIGIIVTATGDDHG